MTLPAQHTTFNTLDNWAIKTPPNQKGPERKGYRVMARNMYTIHSVTQKCSQTDKTNSFLTNFKFSIHYTPPLTKYQKYRKIHRGKITFYVMQRHWCALLKLEKRISP